MQLLKVFTIYIYNVTYIFRWFTNTVKPVLSGHSKRRQKLFFKTAYRLMQVKSIAECSKGSILQYFRPSLSYYLSLRSLFCLFLSGGFRQVLLHLQNTTFDLLCWVVTQFWGVTWLSQKGLCLAMIPELAQPNKVKQASNHNIKERENEDKTKFPRSWFGNHMVSLVNILPSLFCAHYIIYEGLLVVQEM